MFINAIDVNERPKIELRSRLRRLRPRQAENISKLDRTHRLQLCKFLASDDNKISSVAQLSKPQCRPVTTYFRNQHFSVMQISVVLKTKVEFSIRAGDNEPQRRCRAFHAASSISKTPFLPTASVYFLLWLLSLMFSTRHATTDVFHSFTLMQWGALFGMTSTFQPCHKWYITAMTNCSVTCLPSFVLFMLTEASFGEKARRKPLRRMRDITQSVNGGSTAAAASFSWQACLSLSEVIVLQSVN